MPTELKRRGMRFALASASAFVAAMLGDWPSAYLSAVFVTILLESPSAPPVKAGLVLLCASYLVYSLVYWLLACLRFYPSLYFVAVFVSLSAVFALSVAGKSRLLVIMALFAVLILSYLMPSSPDLAWQQAIWLPSNLGIALVFTWLAFALIPDTVTKPQESAEVTMWEPKREHLRMLCATAPFVLLFLLAGGEHLLTLLYFALFAHQLAVDNRGASVSPIEKLVANIVAIMVAVAAYELISLVPQIIFMALVVLLLALLGGWWLVASSNNGNLARSALTGVFILLGDAMTPLAGSVETSALERGFEIAAALVLVSLVFMIIDRCLPQRKMAKN